MRFRPVFLLPFAFAFLPLLAHAAPRNCVVVGISDGDTLTARCGHAGSYEQIKVRIAAIDAPESKQPYGQRSRQALSRLCYAEEAQITPRDTDRYGRMVADVACNGEDAASRMVSGGWAWVYDYDGIATKRGGGLRMPRVRKAWGCGPARSRLRPGIGADSSARPTGATASSEPPGRCHGGFMRTRDHRGFSQPHDDKKMAKDFERMEDSNPSANPTIHEVSDPKRRVFVRGGLAAAVAGLFGPLAAGTLAGCATTGSSVSTLGRAIGFKSVPMAAVDRVVVPEGYSAQVLYRWGDATGIAGRMPAFKTDASNTADEQALQAGMHHDGMAFFPQGGSNRGLLVLNHEYVDDGLLHPDGMKTWTPEKVRKSMNAHGVSVIELQREGTKWTQVLPSRFARRITALTPMTLTGPAAGHPMLRTAADPTGTQVLGTYNNCSNGQTPWGTYLTCEENFADYFEGTDAPDAHQKRWGIKKGNGAKYRWHEHEERFDVAKHPNESNRYGWVVEIDPQDPASTPRKRTALGRAAHEGAATALTNDGRAVIYMGEDSRFEYIYKFVSRDKVQPGGAAANRDLLDHGTLYVGRFDVDGTGEWLPLVQGRNGLVADKGFASQGDVLIKARQASDLLGATRMDRPEWTTVDPLTKEVYCTLTNNSNRGAPGQPFMDAANPRSNNTMGQIIRWKESGDLDATKFAWNHLVLAGDPKQPRYEAQGNIKGDAFGSPDGLMVDARGVLWIQTDVSTSTLGKGEYANLPNNQMLACDPTQGEIRRFLLGPAGCEITGLTATPDLRTLFINVQHPGEPANERSDPERPLAVSKWPDGAGRPRSATVAITKNDGGVIGT